MPRSLGPRGLAAPDYTAENTTPPSSRCGAWKNLAGSFGDRKTAKHARRKRSGPGSRAGTPSPRRRLTRAAGPQSQSLTGPLGAGTLAAGVDEQGSASTRTYTPWTRTMSAWWWWRRMVAVFRGSPALCTMRRSWLAPRTGAHAATPAAWTSAWTSMWTSTTVSIIQALIIHNGAQARSS